MLFSLSRPRLTVRLLIVLTAVVALVSSWPSPASASSGRLSGVVRDNTGEPQADARVVLVEPSGSPAGTETTGSDGRFSIGAAVGRYDLAVVTAARPERRIARVRGVDVGADSELDVVILPPYAKLSGVVRDRAGNALPGVEIFFAGKRVHTDANGRYTLESRPRTDSLQLSWSTNDRSTWLVASIPSFTVTEDRVQDLTFAITRLEIEGRNARGERVAIEAVNASSPNDCHEGCPAGFEFFPGSGETRGFWRSYAIGTAVPMLPGPFVVTIPPADPAYTSVFWQPVAAPWTNPVPIVLPDAPAPEVQPARVTWKGVVRHNGAPVPGVKLSVGNNRWGDHDSDRTDSQGRFDVQITPGLQSIGLTAPIGTASTDEDGKAIPGLHLELADYEIKTGRTMDINLPTEGFAVTVVDSAGHAAPGIYTAGSSFSRSVEILPGARAIATIQNSTQTDAAGKTTFRMFPGAAPSHVIAGSDGNYGWTNIDPGERSATVRLVHTPEVSLSGTVRDARGPLPLVNPVWVSFGGQVEQGDEFNGDFISPTGGYALDAFAGRHTLTMSDLPEHEGLSTSHLAATATLPEEWTITTEFDLPQSRTLDITIPDAGPAHFRVADTNGDPQPVHLQMASTHTVDLGSHLTGTAEAFTGEHNSSGPFQHMMFGPAKVHGSIAFGYDRPQELFYNLALRTAPGDHFVLALGSDYDGGDLVPAAGTSTTSTTAAPTAPTAPTADPASNTAANQSRSGYWAVASDGQVFDFGDAAKLGDTAAGAVDLEPTPSGNGYWTLNRGGRVQAFGDATGQGDVEMGTLATGETPASLSATPTGEGYWVFTNRGRVLAFGDAPFLGDVSHLKLNGPVLGSVATPSGRGYYMVASDGGIFAFGDARFAGSMGGEKLNAPVQSLVPDADGQGYWLVASDGGIFAFDAPFRGSMGGKPLNKPVVGMVRYGDGYLMVGADGGIFNFSSLPFVGSLGDKPPASPVVAVAALP